MTGNEYWAALPNGAEIKEPILETLSEWAQVDINELLADTRIATDLGLDSLDFLEVVMEIEARLDIHIEDEDVEKCVTVAELATVTDRAHSNGPRRKWD